MFKQIQDFFKVVLLLCVLPVRGMQEDLSNTLALAPEDFKNVTDDRMAVLERYGSDRKVKKFTKYDCGPVDLDVERTVRAFLQEAGAAGYDHRIFAVREYEESSNAAVCGFGGRHIVFIGREYINELMNGDEADTVRMKYVIAHEVGHAVAGHCCIGHDETSEADMAESRQHELEADRIGYEIMGRLGYLSTTQAVEHVYSWRGRRVGSRGIARRLDTHPMPLRRLAQLLREEAGRSDAADSALSFDCALLALEFHWVQKLDVVVEHLPQSPLQDRLVERLAAMGVDIKGKVRDKVRSAIRDRDARQVERLLRGKLVNQNDFADCPLLILALQGKRPQVMRVLLKRGDADVNVEDPAGTPVLTLAVKTGNAQAARGLLGEPTIRVNAPDKEDHTALYHAIKGGDPEMVALLSSRPDIDKTAQGSADSYVELALEQGDTKLVCQLLDNGFPITNRAKFESEDNEGISGRRVLGQEMVVTTG